ncbi:MAG: helix-turn-helix domain-containing protein [Anaerolineaceae bacterium]|nr:helix-turn-helix domain-containing protein [Anaerolineaceae bacterium]
MAKTDTKTPTSRWITKRYYPFSLTEEQRESLRFYIASNAGSKTSRLHASIMLMGDISPTERPLGEGEIARALHVPSRMVLFVHRRFLADGLEAGIHPCMQDNRHGRKMSIQAEDRIVALVSSPPPPGRSRWSLRLLSKTMRDEGFIGNMSYELVRRILKSHGIRLDRHAS